MHKYRPIVENYQWTTHEVILVKKAGFDFLVAGRTIRNVSLQVYVPVFVKPAPVLQECVAVA